MTTNYEKLSKKVNSLQYELMDIDNYSEEDCQLLEKLIDELDYQVEKRRMRKMEERKMLKEELQEMLDFIEQDFGVLLNDSKINDSQVAEFETNGKIKFECYHDKNKYAIVSENELDIEGYKDCYGVEGFEVYYYE